MYAKQLGAERQARIWQNVKSILSPSGALEILNIDAHYIHRVHPESFPHISFATKEFNKGQLLRVQVQLVSRGA